jgi:hypothetical protein
MNSRASWRNWKTVISVKRLERLREIKRARRTSGSNKVPTANRKSPIHCSRNAPRHQCGSRFARKTSEGAKYTELGDGAKGIGVLVLNEVRRSMFEQAQRSRDRDSSGRFLARRTGEGNNRGNSQNGRPNDTVVYSTTGHFFTLDFGSGIYSSNRRCQGRKLAETTTPREEDTANKPSDSIIHGQYGSATAFAGWELTQTNETPGQSILLYSRSSMQETSNFDWNTRKRESGRCNDKVDIDAILEELDGLDWDNRQDW